MPGACKLPEETPIAYKSENPKRSGSQAQQRYDKYKAAKTVGEAVRLGASRGDIQNDMDKGFCTQNSAGSEVSMMASPAKAGQKRVADLEPSSAKRQKSEDQSAAPAAAAPVDAVAPVEAAIPVAAPASAVPAVEPAVAAVPAASSSSVSTSSSSSAPAAAKVKVDLSFAKLENKPLKFMKRVMGEAQRLLCPDGLKDAELGGYEFILKDRDNLSRWLVKLRDLNPDGQLKKDFDKHGLEPCMDLEICLPDGFPLEPPFARVVYPKLKGGYVFNGGGICFEPLTTKGWAPSMTLPALTIAIKGIMDYGEVRIAGVGDKATRTVKEYTEQAARKDHSHILSAHRDGDARTYGRTGSS